MQLNNLIIQPLIQTLNFFGSSKDIFIDVLRLDKVHPIVSGNKWYKLKYYLKDAQENNFSSIITFGGAYSNHIVATAFVCNKLGFKSKGIIRGEKPFKLSHTLQDAEHYGMDLIFVSREDYRDKNRIAEQYSNLEYYPIPEGGYGKLGAKGASEIFECVDDLEKYTHIICSCGTGTMLAGIIHSAKKNQTVIGINALKGYPEIEQDIRKIIPADFNEREIKIFNEYHFGGYAKKTSQLIAFMNKLYLENNIPTDIVYSAKLFFAVDDLISKGYFSMNSRLLVINCGGLQGNLSLSKGTLIF
jgi:1-aminocyclopropane-1-carboxylate deaminase